MRYETARAFRTALEQRLKNEAQATGVALLRLRKRVAFERFLARLATSESSGWVLKGAFALELRLGLRARTTKDIDLGRADDEEAATEHLNAAADMDLGDFFAFEVRRTPALDAATGFHAVRYTVRADLDACLFEQFPVDVAFSEATPIQAEPLFGANSLEFADVAALQLPVISLEQHVAEKLHAYTGAFGQDERESTRVKDLVDLVLIGEMAELDAERLATPSQRSSRDERASRSRSPCRRHRHPGERRMRRWLDRSESRRTLAPATQRPLACWTLCFGRRPAVAGTPKKGFGVCTTSAGWKAR